MLPYSLGKEIEENAENLAPEAVAHSPPLLHNSYSSFSPVFDCTLREEGGNHLLRSSSPLNCTKEITKSKSPEPCKLNGF